MPQNEWVQMEEGWPLNNSWPFLAPSPRSQKAGAAPERLIDSLTELQHSALTQLPLASVAEMFKSVALDRCRH